MSCGGRWVLEGGVVVLKKNGLGCAEPVGHGDGVEKRVQLVNDCFEAEGNFFCSPRAAQASAAFAILSPFSSLARTSARWVFIVVSRAIASMGGSFGTTHACCAGEVERSVSNLMAHLARSGSSSNQRVSWPKWAQEQVCLHPDSGRI